MVYVEFLPTVNEQFAVLFDDTQLRAQPAYSVAGAFIVHVDPSVAPGLPVSTI